MEARGDRAQRTALVALATTVVLTAAKLVVWGATGSLTILSQALDSAVDIVVLSLVAFAVRFARKPADRTHQYGHAKAENLVALGQMIVLGVFVVVVGAEAIGRLASGGGEAHAPGYAIAVIALSLAVDLVRARMLIRTGRAEGSAALSAGALNVIADSASAVVALISLGLVRAGFDDADPIGSLVVGLAVTVAAVRAGKRSVDVLMDRAPQAQVAAIEAAASAAAGVAETRRVRVRGDERQFFADVTIAARRTDSLERAHDIAERVEQEIARAVPGTDVVVHVEPVHDTSGLVERVRAAASRADGVHEIHNVNVHSFSEGGRDALHATLHAKVESGLSLGEAHDLSDRIEESVRGELGEDVRVDTHIEPLETTTAAKDVTADRPELVATIRRLALEEADVKDCHEVVLTSSGEQLAVVAHVGGRGDLALARMHEASERIEHA
ncbi:MAG TPA: cation diffusion facilitator family transporter, partial [Actinomycetota bacterium]